MGTLHTRTLGYSFPRIQTNEPERTSERLTVWLDGVKEVNTRPGPRIETYLLDQGDFLNVGYVRGEFNGAGAARTLANFCKHYERVTLIGASGGGLLAYDTLACLPPAYGKYRIILIDAPFEGNDISSGAARRLADWVPSRATLPTFINKRLTGRSSLAPEPGLTEEELRLIEVHRQRVGRLPIGTLASRLRFIYQHPKPRPRVLDGVSMAIVSSKDDPVVSPKARNKWAAVNPSAVVVEADAVGHVATLEQAKTWHTTISQTFEAL